MKSMKSKTASSYMKGGAVPNGKMMKNGGSNPVGTGGMKNPNKPVTCNFVNQ